MFCEQLERRRDVVDEAMQLIVIADDDQNRLVLFPAFEMFNSANRFVIKRVCAQPIERVGAKGNDPAASDYLSGSINRRLLLRNNHFVSWAPLGAECL